MESVSLFFAFVAGALSFLNPCVLPLLPIILAAAASKHRLGPLALAGGLALSFATFGVFIATIGFSLGMDGGSFQTAAALFLMMIGLVLTVPQFQGNVALAARPLVNWADRRFGNVSESTLAGQFGVGLLLGIVWTPCVGPTLGAVSVLAAQGRDLGQVVLTMVVFSLGAVAPLVLLGLASRHAILVWRGRILSVGLGAKMVLGIMLIVLGTLILTGLDKPLQTLLLDLTPEWLNNFTTQF